MTMETNNPATILLVDDTPGSIGVALTALEEAGYRVAIATSGEKALQRAVLVMPDLILLDVIMPGLDGYEVCRRLKAQEGTRDIPVIFLSAQTETFDKVKGFGLGAVDYLIKPVASEELLARVHSHVTVSRLERELRAANRSLEERVAARTVELRDANMRLLEEIEERKRTGDALRQSEQKFRAIFDQTFQFIGLLSVEGILLQANQTALQFAGATEDAIIGKFFWETPWWTHSPEMQQRLRMAVQEAAGGKMVRFEATHTTPDGQVHWIDFSLKPVTDAAGRVVQLIPEGRDITERKQAEEEIRKLNAELEQRVIQRTRELAESEARFRTIYDTSPVSIWREDWNEVIAAVNQLRDEGVTDFEAYFHQHPEFVERALNAVKILDVNQWTLDMFEAQDKAEMLGSLETIFATPDTLPGFVGELVALARGQAVYRAEMCLCTVKGNQIDSLLAMSFPPPGTDPGNVLVSLIDITERKRFEQALQRSEEYYRLLFDTMLQGVVYQDATGKITSMNAAAERILGERPEEFFGHASVDQERLIVHVDGSPFPGAEHPSRVALRTGEVVKNVVMGVFNPRESDYRWISISATPFFRKEEKSPYLVYTLFDDITERKRAEDNIVKLNADLERRAALLEVANKELESFSYSVSHDLRAPLRSIDGFSRILEEDYSERLDDEGREYLGKIRVSTQHMGELIDDILLLSRVTLTELRRTPVDLSALASVVGEGLRAAEPQRSVELVIEPGLIAQADEQLMRIVFENLLGNAWKFTGRQPAPRIEFGRMECDGAPVYFVRDNGAGFDAQYADKLFQAFQRLHSVSEFPGTGIGLATVQRVIHRHDGRVWAEGEPGHGATIFFTLPDSN